MVVRGLSDIRDNSDNEDSPGFHTIKTREGFVPGNGLLDKTTFMESFPQYFRRITRKKMFWFKIIIYIILQYFSIYVLEMGDVFFMIAVLYLVSNSLGTRSQGQRSAYSVFNKKQERIHGDKKFDARDAFGIK
jgi:hypothetical protein